MQTWVHVMFTVSNTEEPVTSGSSLVNLTIIRTELYFTFRFSRTLAHIKFTMSGIEVHVYCTLS